jgi:hypothetical protein
MPVTDEQIREVMRALGSKKSARKAATSRANGLKNRKQKPAPEAADPMAEFLRGNCAQETAEKTNIKPTLVLGVN